MRSKLLSVLGFFVSVLCVFTFVYANRYSKTDFSDTTLVYENDGRYYYDNLDSNAKTAYTLILPGLYKHREAIEIPEITSEEFNLLMYALSYDNPDLCCIGTQSSLKTQGNRFYYCPSYTHSEQECAAVKERLETAVSKALSGISKDAGEYEKELYVHDYICKICTYDESGDKQDKISAYSVFVDGSAVCEGYAKAAKLLLDRLSVKNYLITGNAADESGGTQGHMWNIVTVNSQNYHLDITWDDMDSQELFDGNHIYFNLTDEMMGKTHSDFNPAENNCNFTDYNYGNVTKMRFEKYDAAARKSIINNIRSNYNNGKNICEFGFTSEKEYKSALNALTENDGLGEIFRELYRTYNIRFENVQYITDDNLYAFMFAFS